MSTTRSRIAGALSGGVAGRMLLQKDGQRDGFCVSNRRNTNGLDNASGQTASRVHVSRTSLTTVWPTLCHWPGHSSVNLVIGEDDPMPHRPLQSRRWDQRKKGFLEHLDRDGMAAVLHGLPAVRLRHRSRFLFWLTVVCHVPSTKRKVRLEARHKRLYAAGLPLPPLRSTANHPSR
jgi:hypothetical protein